jgi:hypothetical protein
MNELFYLLVVEQKLGCGEVGKQAPHVAELNIACQEQQGLRFSQT